MRKVGLVIFVLIAAMLYWPLNSANAAMMAKKANMMNSIKNACQKKANMVHYRMNVRKIKLIARGKKLFYSKSIGTNGFSCATCHVYSAGTYINMHGIGKVIRPLKNVRQKLMAFDKIHHKHLTLKGKIRLCDKFALKGTGLTGRQLKALTAYVSSLR
jgi:cytochrome c